LCVSSHLDHLNFIANAIPTYHHLTTYLNGPPPQHTHYQTIIQNKPVILLSGRLAATSVPPGGA